MAEENVNTGIADNPTPENTGAEQAQSQEQGQEQGNAQEQTQAFSEKGIADPEPNPSNKGIADSKQTMEKASENQKPPVYDYELKANEGEDLTFLNKLCKDLKISQQQAEGLLEGLRNQNKLDIEGSQKQQMAERKNTITQWQSDTYNDPVYGGKNYSTTCHNAGKVFDAFDVTDPNLIQKYGTVRDFMINSNLQYNPVAVQFFARIGASMGEDKFIGSNGKQGSEELSLAERMYPGMNTKGE